MDDDQRAAAVRAALLRAATTLGSMTAIARACGASENAPHMWRTRGRVPAEYCPDIERDTRRVAGEKADSALVVTCEELCPDVSWGVLRQQPAQQAA